MIAIFVSLLDFYGFLFFLKRGEGVFSLTFGSIKVVVSDVDGGGGGGKGNGGDYGVMVVVMVW